MNQLARCGFVAFESSIADPVGKTIAAEAREPHQFDILGIVAMTQMTHKTSECRSGNRIIKRIERIIFS